MLLLLFGCTTTYNQPTQQKNHNSSMEQTMEKQNISAPNNEHHIVRFIAMGDGGEGNADQYQNAQAIRKICNQKTDTQPGCGFALYLGDNFYDVGVDDITDHQFQDKFEKPYAELPFPFYSILGNHDYGGCLANKCGLGWEFTKSKVQINYTKHSKKWNMPAEYYTFVEDHVQFFGLDTNAILWDPWLGTAKHQPSWFAAEMASSQTTWKVVFGHHPYISNGKHGNAGNYERIDWFASLLSVPAGVAIKDFFDNHICHKADIYLSGHDHNRQWLQPTCGTEFIVSGAAAKTSALSSTINQTRFEDDSMVGFIWIQIENNCLNGEFYDKTGSLNFSHTVCK